MMRSAFSATWIVLAFSVLPASAQRLPATVIPDHYDLAFVVDLAHNRFEGTEAIRVQAPQPTKQVVLHAVDIEFREVTIGDGSAAQRATVTKDAAAQTATLAVPQPIAKGATTIHIRYTGTLNDELRGFYRSRGGHRAYAVTQFEATDARRAFPCFDEPAYKATFALTLTVDRGDVAISNGKVLSDVPGPAATQHTIKFATTPRMSTYLVAMAVGDFQCLQGSAENIPIRICAIPEKKDLGRIALESAEQILRFYNTYYSIKYPFAKLDVVAVPDFAAGAMENTAAIFYRETDLLADSKNASVATRKTIASVLAHEMAHQWFGDLVTMEWWDDIWLNEGFATWMANKPLAAAHPDWNVPVDEAGENQTALNLDSLKSTRAIHAEADTPAQIDAAFDAIAYEKGAAVVRMIENYVGAETFRKGVNAYLESHAYKNAAAEDFWKAIAATSGKPVERIMPTFVNQPGVPLIEVSRLTCEGGKTRATLAQSQFVMRSEPSTSRRTAGSQAAPSGRWQVPICVSGGTSAAPICEILTEPRQTLTAANGCAPWIFANAGARGYYRTAYPPEMLRLMAPHVETDLTAAERFSLVDDEWALVRAGRHSVADYLTLISGFGREHTSGILKDVTDRLGFIGEYLVAPTDAARLQAFTRSLLRPLYEELGFSGTASEKDDRRELRAAVVLALGTTGNDPDVIAKARTALDRSLAGGPALEPTLAAPVMAIAAMHGDAKLYDALTNATTKAASPEDQYRALYALAKFPEPALIDRGLKRTLTSDIRTQDLSIYLARFFDNPAARERAWAFVKSNWSVLAPKIAIFGGDTSLVRALGTFCDASRRDDITSFFAAHRLPSAARTLDQTIERIDNCVALRTTQMSPVSAWLDAR
jgi:aminopeptidase N